jgi:hypothetical protein
MNSLLESVWISDAQKRRVRRITYETFYVLGVDTADIHKTIINVSGSTSNVYTVGIDENNRISCNCPDSYTNCQDFNLICKHVCFILCRVGNIFDSTIFTTSTISEQQRQILHYYLHFSKNDTNVFNDEMTERFRNMQINSIFVSNEARNLEEECPICYLKLKRDDLETLTTCPDCKNSVHRDCVTRWYSLNGIRNCIICRSEKWKYFDREYTNLNSNFTF